MNSADYYTGFDSFYLDEEEAEMQRADEPVVGEVQPVLVAQLQDANRRILFLEKALSQARSDDEMRRRYPLLKLYNGVISPLRSWSEIAGVPAATETDKLQDANKRIGDLEQALHLANLRAQMASETDSDKPAPPATDVDRVIDQLGRRIVPTPDMDRLQGALDTARKPLGGRDGANEAVGRAIRWGV